jgi:hypothetical protein
VVSHPVVAHAYSFLTHPPLPNVPYTFSFPWLPPHDRGLAWCPCHHHSRLCSSEGVTSRTRCWMPIRPSPLSFYPPAAPSSLYHCSRSDPPYTGIEDPCSNGPCHHTLALPFPPAQPGHRARPRDPRVVHSHTRAACTGSPLPGRTRRHFDPKPLLSPLFLLPSTLHINEQFHTSHSGVRRTCLRPRTLPPYTARQPN